MFNIRIHISAIDKKNILKESREFWYLLVLCSFCLPDTDFIIYQDVFILLLELIILL